MLLMESMAVAAAVQVHLPLPVLMPAVPAEMEVVVASSQVAAVLPDQLVRVLVQVPEEVRVAVLSPARLLVY